MTIDRNNPGNIRKSAAYTWQGEQPGIAVGDFVIFDTLTNGYRAMVKDLQTSIGEGNNTITKLLTKYAPPEENDTAAYIAHISDDTGIDADQALDSNDLDTLGNIAYSMSFVEHDIQKDDGTLQAALNAAKNILSSVIDTAKSNPGASLLFFALILGFIFLYKKDDKN